jgi:hypothetical protein
MELELSSWGPVTQRRQNSTTIGAMPSFLAAGACDESGNDVGGVAVEGTPGPVGTHRRSRVRMRRGLLDITQSDSGIEPNRILS